MEDGSDPCSYEHYLSSSENKAWKKIQACLGFKPKTSATPALVLETSWVIGHGSNPIQAWIFFRPYLYYYLSSLHNWEDCFHIHFFNCSSHIWFSYICSHLLIEIHSKLLELDLIPMSINQLKHDVSGAFYADYT